MRFEATYIKKCCICGKENIKGISEGVTRDIGIGTSHQYEEFCLECFEKNTFENSNGFTFLKLDKKLFCYKPNYYLDFGFRQVISEKEIERAFNPEYYDFQKWLNIV